MLDLESRVHLEEVETRRVAGPFDEELHGPGVPIACPARDGNGSLTHALPQRRTDCRRRTLLNHLLVAPLDRALALEQMDDVIVMIGEDLKLDMARPLDETLDVQRPVAEGRHRFTSRLRDRREQHILVAGRLHPDTAATLGRLQQYRKADTASGGCNRLVRLIRGRLAGNDRHTGLGGKAPRGDLRSHPLDGVRRRSDERQSRFFARRGEARVLRKETVAGMNGLCSALARRREDGVDGKVALGCGRRGRCESPGRQATCAAPARRRRSRRRPTRCPFRGRPG